jgi:hypothetical protein
MEIITGISLVSIFLDNNNWWRFFLIHQKNLRLAIIINVVKMLSCRSSLMGFRQFTCPHCEHSITISFSCKSRFCPCCGKKATDNWIYQNFNTMPNTRWQHITFTMPSEIWDLFWLNRYLLNLIPALAANVIKKIAKQQGVFPGIFTALHTFGRDLKRNVHIHLSVTIGGLINGYTKWGGSNLYFYHLSVKQMWRYALIDLLRKQYQAGKLKLPRNLKHVKNYSAFNSWLNFLYTKKWVVNLQKPSKNHKRNIEYLGKYLKRPPIGETRIKKYDGKYVTFEYLDHYDNSKKNITMPVMEFIGKVVSHIHDANFRCIRYFGFLANRVRGKLLPLVHALLNSTTNLAKKIYIPWRTMIIESLGFDPLICPNCRNNLLLSNISFASKINFLSMHKQIACR